jgi:hypothetical protein
MENELLTDVVQRFRRGINTMGKIHKLAHISVDDCEMFEDFMTKYSTYEHSQSYEIPEKLSEIYIQQKVCLSLIRMIFHNRASLWKRIKGYNY